MTPAPPASRPLKFDALEGWRGVACLLVVLYHCGVSQTHPPLAVVGFVGVHMFFVLSGYLLFRPYAAALTAGRPLPSLGNFYARRFLRIVPPYLVSLAAFVALRAASGTKPPDLTGIATHALLVFNYVPRVGFYSINPVYWSLAIEAQFYLLLPLLCMAVAGLFPTGGPRRAGACAGVMFAVGVAARWAEVRRSAGSPLPDDGVAFRTVFAYLDLFAFGMAVACLPPAGGRAGRWVAVGLALAAVFAADDWCVATAGGGWQRGGTTAFLILFPVPLAAGLAGLLWAVVGGGGAGPAWLRAAPLRLVGEVSFSLYLYHVGVQFAVARLHLFDGWGYRTGSLAFAAVSTPPAVAVAALMYFAVERPSVRWVGRVRTGRPAGGPAVADPPAVLLGP